MKKVLCIVLVVAVLLAGGILAYVSFAGGETWTPTEGRTWTQADFDFLERGLSFREIVAVVGEPNMPLLAGWPRPYYRLDIGTLTLWFNEQSGSPSEFVGRDLASITIRYSEGGSREIVLEE